LVREGGF